MYDFNFSWSLDLFQPPPTSPVCANLVYYTYKVYVIGDGDLSSHVHSSKNPNSDYVAAEKWVVGGAAVWHCEGGFGPTQYRLP